MVGVVGPVIFALPFIINDINVFLLIYVGLLKEYDVDILGCDPVKNVCPFFVVT